MTIRIAICTWSLIHHIGPDRRFLFESSRACIQWLLSLRELWFSVHPSAGSHLNPFPDMVSNSNLLLAFGMDPCQATVLATLLACSPAGMLRCSPATEQNCNAARAQRTGGRHCNTIAEHCRNVRVGVETVVGLQRCRSWHHQNWNASRVKPTKATAEQLWVYFNYPQYCSEPLFQLAPPDPDPHFDPPMRIMAQGGNNHLEIPKFQSTGQSKLENSKQFYTF